MIENMSNLLQIDQKSMGERIKLARKNKLLTQEAIAEHAGISLNFYGMIERGEKGLSVKTLAQICDILGESMDYIVSGKIVDAQNNPIVRHYNSLTPRQRKAAEYMFEAWIYSIKFSD